jgi:hypothetical protein
MTTSEDVKTLFRRFGGQPETYQEVVREDLAEHSLGKWPMLGQVNLQKIELIPAAKQTIKTVATRPYSESLAVATAGKLAVADYVASHRYAEPLREPLPVAAPAYEPPRSPVARAPAEPNPAPVAVTPTVVAPVKAAMQAAAVVQEAMHAASSGAVRVSALPQVSLPLPSAPAVVVAAAALPTPRAEQAVSGLAARFRAQAAPVATPTPELAELPPQSLHGLFGRLAQSQTKAQAAVGLLKRKLTL